MSMVIGNAFHCEWNRVSMSVKRFSVWQRRGGGAYASYRSAAPPSKMCLWKSLIRTRCESHGDENSNVDPMTTRGHPERSEGPHNRCEYHAMIVGVTNTQCEVPRRL